MYRLLLAALAVALAVGCASEPTTKKQKPAKTASEDKETDTGSGDGKEPVVLMKTSMGDIKIELYPDKAPITVKNFLQYVDDKFYDGTIFHRVMSNFMIQGGGFRPGMQEKQTRDTITNESPNGLSNVRGSIAMARLPQPDTASAQFFINVVDNSRLDAARYCVFGKVIKGMDVVDKIKEVEVHDVGSHENVPVKDVVIESVRRVEK